METPEYRLELIHMESERLDHYFHTLPPPVWSQPSACQRWAVHDVVGHLILGAELYINSVRRGLEGDTTPLDGWPAAGAANAASAAPLLAHVYGPFLEVMNLLKNPPSLFAPAIVWQVLKRSLRGFRHRPASIRRPLFPGVQA